jgi:hypothetical protein
MSHFQDNQKIELELQKKSVMNHVTSMTFLGQHKGFRDGKMHVISAPTDSGKSTLVRTIILDHLTANQEMTIFLYLSEETTIDFKVEMLQIIKDIQKESPVRAQKLQDLFNHNLVIYSEQDPGVNERDPITMVNDLALMFAESGAHILIIDNLTTSGMYADKQIHVQSRIATRVKKMAQTFQVPVVPIMHLGKGKGVGAAGEPSKDDVRGGATIINLAEFSYMLQMIQIDDKKHTFVRADKSRGFNKLHQYFSLEYNPKMQIYQKCIPVKFANFKEKFNLRNRLTDKKK